MKFFLSLCLLCLSLFASAQKKQNIYYLKNDGREVVEDSSDFMRVIREPDSGLTNFELFEYFRNGKLKRIGYVSSFEPKLTLEGYIREFYPNGHKKEVSNFIKNQITGESSQYYPNGIVKRKQYFTVAGDYFGFPERKNCVVKYLGDSLGTAFLDSTGTGKFEYNEDGDANIAGSYLNGRPDGEWKTFFKNDSAVLREIYNNGQFISGSRMEKNGRKTEFTEREILPEFVGGQAGFGRYIMKNFIYPTDARRNNLSGKVIVSFVVNGDGSIVDIKILRGIGGGCDEEVKRVMLLSPKWKPGIQNGKPVRVAYTLPVQLGLKDPKPDMYVPPRSDGFRF